MAQGTESTVIFGGKGARCSGEAVVAFFQTAIHPNANANDVVYVRDEKMASDSAVAECFWVGSCCLCTQRSARLNSDACWRCGLTAVAVGQQLSLVLPRGVANVLRTNLLYYITL